MVVVIAIALQAQQPDHPFPGRMHHPDEFMLQKLNLTEEQKAKFKSQQESFRKQLEELKKNENITVKEWRSRMEALRKEHKAKMQGLLTTEQKAQLEKMKAEHKAMQEIDAKAQLEKMKIHLGLSDEQAATINKNRTEMMEKMKTLREDDKMDMEKKREQMKELMKERKEQMKSILTEEQMKKLQEGRPHGPEGMHGKKPGKKEVI
jgi:Spy/CpxP family protein refolding chaperone